MYFVLKTIYVRPLNTFMQEINQNMILLRVYYLSNKARNVVEINHWLYINENK